jgi:hypothetical protein
MNDSKIWTLTSKPPGMKKDGRDIRRLKTKIKRLEEATQGMTVDELLALLNSDAEMPIDDLRWVHEACQSMSPTESQIARGVFEDTRFKDWVKADDSAALFIEGGPGLVNHGRFASLSLLSCLTIAGLEGKEPAIPIHHFCRRHISSRDPLHGPRGMMRSLIDQVVRLYQSGLNLSFASSRRYREQLQAHDLRTLCDCFANVVKQLPHDTVLFCIVDSIDAFERREWEGDCRFMIREIQDILDEYQCGPEFKLLFTSPGRSRYVGGMFAPLNRLFLSPGGEGRGDPSERDIARGARRQRVMESAAFQSLRQAFPADDSSGELSDSDFSWGSGHE